MKRAATIAVIAIMATAATAADVTVQIAVTIPQAKVTDVVDTMAWMGDNLYATEQVVTPATTNTIHAYDDGTNSVPEQVIVTPARTNDVQVIVSETPTVKFKRISSRQIVRFWSGKLAQHAAATAPDDDAGITTE